MSEHSDFEIVVMGSDEVDPLDDNVDVEIKFPNGARFTGTFFTLQNLAPLFEKK